VHLLSQPLLALNDYYPYTHRQRHRRDTNRTLKVKDAILDGEIVALDGCGKPAFYSLMKRECPAVYYAFDVLWLNGRDVRNLPLVERKKILRKVIPRKSSSVGCVSYVDRDALKLFELVKKGDLEGLVVNARTPNIHSRGFGTKF